MIYNFCFGFIFVGFLANIAVYLFGTEYAIILKIYQPWWFGYTLFSLISGVAWASIKNHKLRAKRDAENKQFAKAKQVIDAHAKELSIRRNQLTVKTSYGLTDDKKWRKEMGHFFTNVISPAIGAIDDPLGIKYQLILLAIEQETANYQDAAIPFSRKMSPTEYERLVANTLIEHGWDARITVATGDQGIDVIAEKHGIKVVVQCKLYSNNVGNTAVQEVIAGKVFEKADFAAVVTNADFTKSAKQLATSSGVFILHHDQLIELEAMCLG